MTRRRRRRRIGESAMAATTTPIRRECICGSLLWEPFGGFFEPSWDPLRAILGASGALLGGSWGPFAYLGGPLGPFSRTSINEGEVPVSPAPLEPQTRLFGSSLGALGCSWSPCGASVGPFWSSLGPARMDLDASRAHWRRNGEKANALKHILPLKDVCLSGSPWAGSAATRNRLGVSWSMLESTLSDLALPCSILEAILGSRRPS